MNAHELKQAVAKEAISRVATAHGDNLVLGIGTGSTAECFIAELPHLRDRILSTVSSSERSTALLRELGFEVKDLNDVDHVDVYVDGADESTAEGFLKPSQKRPSRVSLQPMVITWSSALAPGVPRSASSPNCRIFETAF